MEGKENNVKEDHTIVEILAILQKTYMASKKNNKKKTNNQTNKQTS